MRWLLHRVSRFESVAGRLEYEYHSTNPHLEIPPSCGGISSGICAVIERPAMWAQIEQALRRSRVVALVGPQQCGQTTVGRYLDLQEGVFMAHLLPRGDTSWELRH